MKLNRKLMAVVAVALLVLSAGIVLAQVTSLPTLVAGRFASQSTPALAATSLSGCGTSPSVVGNETGAVITIGAAPGAACTVTFTAAYVNAPACLALNQTTAANLIPKVSTTTTAAIITFTAGPTAADKVSLVCMGVAGS